MKLVVIKKKDDPIAMRISIGGDFKNAYCVYRGELKKVKMLLLEVAESLSKLEKEPDISDDEGKNYA